MLKAIYEALLQELKGKLRNSTCVTQLKKPEAAPYCHRVALNFKNVATRCHVTVAFLATLNCQNWAVIYHKGLNLDCEKKHAKLVECPVGVAYKILLACSQICLDQIGRCSNERLNEHYQSLPTGTSSHITPSVTDCD